MALFTSCIVLFGAFFFIVNCQLVVNVRNNGGDVYRETIEANTTQDTISLDFRKSDGTLITQLIDGKNVNKPFIWWLRLYTCTLCPSILKWLYTGLSVCIAILVYLGTGLGTSLFLGRGTASSPDPTP